MISNDSLLTSSGFSAWKSGLNPLNTVVRFSGGWVCVTGTVASGCRYWFIGPLPRWMSRYRCPTRFWYLIANCAPVGSLRSSSTLNSTWATDRSTTWTSVTSPTRTPAMRTSLPAIRPDASVKSAL